MTWFDNYYEDIEQSEELTKVRGLGPSLLECIVIVYVLGYILEETREVFYLVHIISFYLIH